MWQKKKKMKKMGAKLVNDFKMRRNKSCFTGTEFRK